MKVLLKDLVQSSRVLELGSGAGLLGIILAQMQTSASQCSEGKDTPSLYLTDLDDQVLERCEANVHISCSEFGFRKRTRLDDR